MRRPPNNLLTFVIPLKDEEKTLRELFERVSREAALLGRPFEVVFVDDGSIDGSWEVIQSLAAARPFEVVAFRLRRNGGKAQALAVGFQAARGDIIFTMDADLEDDPAEIGRFLETLGQGFDVVSGWRKNRRLPWHRALANRVFNKMLSSLEGVDLHDHYCGFKCYRAAAIRKLRISVEHRLIPSLGSIKGFRSTEIVVDYRPCPHAKRESNMRRFGRSLLEMQSVYFLKHVRERPLHLLGGAALTIFILACAVLVTSFYPGVSPLTAARIILLAEGLGACAMPLLVSGLVGELLVRGKIGGKWGSTVTEEIRPGARPESDNAGDFAPGLSAGDAPVVLVADDEVEIRELMRLQLEGAGFRVKEAADGNEMLAQVDDETGVVLLDLAMPGKGGLECMLQMRDRYAEVPIVVVSGNQEISTAVQAMKLGAFDYVAKPFDSRHLLNSVNKALKTRGLPAELARTA